MYKSEKISELIAEYRVINKKATYEQIAEEIGISKNSLMNYASGKAKPTVEMLEKIAIFFHKNIDHFFENQFSLHQEAVQSSMHLRQPEEEYKAIKADEKTLEKMLDKIFEQHQIIMQKDEQIMQLTLENHKLRSL